MSHNKPTKTASHPIRRPGDAPEPVRALERPTGLKKWASELVGIVKAQESELFTGWDFSAGSLTKLDFTRILRKISGCGSVVELRSALDRGTGEIGAPAVHAANYCGQHTICPYCAGRVQDRRGARFRASIEAMAGKYPFAYMVTATIPPVPTWREDLDKLISGWQDFRRMGQVRRRKRKDGTIVESRSGGEWGKVRAGLAKIELKRGSGSGMPHCHYHAIVFTEKPFDYRVWDQAEKHLPKERRRPLYRLPRRVPPSMRFRPCVPAWRLRPALTGWVAASKITSEWFKASGGINFRLDPLKYRPCDKKAGRSYEESIFDQSREVLKYATKFDSCPEKGAEALFGRDFIGIRDATYNRRLFVAYGDFRKVPGNDFEGGGPHISEGPIIYEARWRGVEYSPLIQRSRPIFLNSDASPAVTARLNILNRAQGQVRRMRSAIVAAKRHFQSHFPGQLRPAFYLRRLYAEDGSYKEIPMALEVPAYVAAAPHNPATWEQWMDTTMEKGRAYYAGVRDSVGLQSLENIDGTIQEQAAARSAELRAWSRSDGYEMETARLFRDTLNRSREMINAPP